MGKERLARYREAKANGGKLSFPRPFVGPRPAELDAPSTIVRALRSEAARYRKKRAELAAMLEAFDARMQDIGGCGDGYCLVRGKAKGQHTNAGCRCWRDQMTAQRMMRAARILRDGLEELK